MNEGEREEQGGRYERSDGKGEGGRKEEEKGGGRKKSRRYFFPRPRPASLVAKITLPTRLLLPFSPFLPPSLLPSPSD